MEPVLTRQFPAIDMLGTIGIVQLPDNLNGFKQPIKPAGGISALTAFNKDGSVNEDSVQTFYEEFQKHTFRAQNSNFMMTLHVFISNDIGKALPAVIKGQTPFTVPKYVEKIITDNHPFFWTFGFRERVIQPKGAILANP